MRRLPILISLLLAAACKPSKPPQRSEVVPPPQAEPSPAPEAKAEPSTDSKPTQITTDLADRYFAFQKDFLPLTIAYQAKGLKRIKEADAKKGTAAALHLNEQASHVWVL